MPASGPLVLTPIPTTVVFSPDAKVTTVNHSTATLTGAYLGKLYDDQLFLGVGGYWLANPRTDARLFYVGFIGGWRLYGGPRLKLSARALAGVGAGTAFVTFTADQGGRGPHASPQLIINRRVGLSDNFLVIEPEVDVACRSDRRDPAQSWRRLPGDERGAGREQPLSRRNRNDRRGIRYRPVSATIAIRTIL